MKKTGFLFLLIMFSLSISAQKDNLNWFSNYLEAKDVAQSTKKNILYFFTDNTKSQQAQNIEDLLINSRKFQRITKRFVLLKVDYSVNNELTKSEQAYNKRLVLHFNKGLVFPALLAIGPNGRQLGLLQTNFSTKSSVEYINFLKSL